MVIQVQEGNELVRGLLTTGHGGVIVATGIGQGIVTTEDVTEVTAIEIMVIVLMGQDVVKIEHRHVVVTVVVLVQPVIDQPVVEGAGVGGIGPI